jgi:hypothetical protein
MIWQQSNLWITSGINLIIILFYWFLIQKPHLANYPIEITDENRERTYRKNAIIFGGFKYYCFHLFLYGFKALNYNQLFYLFVTLFELYRL